MSTDAVQNLTSPEPSDWLAKTGDVARRLGVPSDTVVRLCDRGMPHRRQGAFRTYHVDLCEKWFKKNQHLFGRNGRLLAAWYHRREPDLKPGKVYALRDPRDGSIMYVGKTSRTLQWRLRRHIIDSRKNRFRPLYKWIASLGSIGLTPEIALLEDCPAGRVDQSEMEWIKKLSDQGCDLLNVVTASAGGHEWTDAQRRAQSERCASVNQKLAASRMGLSVDQWLAGKWFKIVDRENWIAEQEARRREAEREKSPTEFVPITLKGDVLIPVGVGIGRSLKRYEWVAMPQSYWPVAKEHRWHFKSGSRSIRTTIDRKKPSLKSLVQKRHESKAA